jgi:hypothetical protein
MIGQGAMLVKADLMIVCVVLASNYASLLVHLIVKAEHILGHHVQEMHQSSSLSSVLVMDCSKREHLMVDVQVASCLDWLGVSVGAHAGFCSAWFLDGCGKLSLY